MLFATKERISISICLLAMGQAFIWTLICCTSSIDSEQDLGNAFVTRFQKNLNTHGIISSKEQFELLGIVILKLKTKNFFRCVQK